MSSNMRIPHLLKTLQPRQRASFRLGQLILLAAAAALPACSGGGGLPFPCLPQEGFNLHLHPYLQIKVEGDSVTIPTNVGILGNCFEPLHTHDDSGIIHIEADHSQDYTLGDFFKVWGVSANPNVFIKGKRYPVTYARDELLGHKVDQDHVIRLLVDGKPSNDGPDLVLNRLNYCTAGAPRPPCATQAASDPAPQDLLKKYGGGHTIVLEYATKG